MTFFREKVFHTGKIQGHLGELVISGGSVPTWPSGWISLSPHLPWVALGTLRSALL